MKKIGRYWEKNNDVHCTLCPHYCSIKNGGRGKCGVRGNENGTLYSLIYGSCSSTATDPIEKKPLFHFHPGSLAFSVGSVGCNLHCQHCQNYSISTKNPDDLPLHELSAEECVARARQLGCDGISWTYNEPTIWWEYTFDAARMAKKMGLYTSYVTNGFINEDPLREIAPYLDAANIDVKAMSNDFYKKICGGRLDPVLETCVCAHELGIHIELTYLIVPGHNDSAGELRKFCEWVFAHLGEGVPIHFSAFHPDYRMTRVSATSLGKLQEAFDICKKVGLTYVYLGNVPHGDYENTWCPQCGELLVERYGFSTTVKGLLNNACRACGRKIPIVLPNARGFNDK